MDLEPGEETSLYRVEHSDINFSSKDGTNSDKLTNGHDHNSQTPAGKSKMASKTAKAPVRPASINLENASTLGDAARVVRSKNSGPYEITLDVLFDRREVFDIIRDSNILTDQVVANLYGVESNSVLWCGYFEQANAFKATLPRMRKGRPVASGGFMENDVHGSQHHVPLMELQLPRAVQEKRTTLVV
jgi:hypothetical protein